MKRNAELRTISTDLHDAIRKRPRLLAELIREAASNCGKYTTADGSGERSEECG